MLAAVLTTLFLAAAPQTSQNGGGVPSNNSTGHVQQGELADRNNERPTLYDYNRQALKQEARDRSDYSVGQSAAGASGNNETCPANCGIESAGGRGTGVRFSRQLRDPEIDNY